METVTITGTFEARGLCKIIGLLGGLYRNKVMHKNERVDRDQAKKCLDVAKTRMSSYTPL